MAESPEGLHDSRFSVWGPHTTTRGASAPAVLGDLAAAERHLDCLFDGCSPCHLVQSSHRRSQRPQSGIGSANWRNGRPVRMALNRSSGSCPTVLVRCKPRPTFGDFPAFLTHSRLPPAAGAHCRSHSSRNLSWGTGSLPPSALRMAISLPSLPPFLPPVSGGSSCRGPGDRGPGIWVDAKHRKQINTEKHLWLDSL